jgi:hypothetical protein
MTSLIVDRFVHQGEHDIRRADVAQAWTKESERDANTTLGTCAVNPMLSDGSAL